MYQKCFKSKFTSFVSKVVLLDVLIFLYLSQVHVDLIDVLRDKLRIRLANRIFWLILNQQSFEKNCIKCHKKVSY